MAEGEKNKDKQIERKRNYYYYQTTKKKNRLISDFLFFII